MNLILSIETSVKTCSVALSNTGITLNCIEINADGFVHAEKLTLLIQELFDQQPFSIKDLSAVCISSGPGSFTGLRIGVAVAKGLCYGLNIPLIEINSLEVLFQSFLTAPNYIASIYYIPMIDARRMEVYCAGYSINSSELFAPKALVVSNDSFLNIEECVFFGDGADKLVELSFTNQKIKIIEGIKPSASSMSSIAFQKFESKQFQDIAYFEPFYLKEFGETTH
jgi:tRNA threonylcarbamoyladenosine biosynthesis protein TsaB